MTPEEIELDKKAQVLERLSDRLAAREEEIAELRMGLQQFEAQYTMQVGRLYADLDDLEAQIAEEEYKLVPDDEEIKRKAEEMRRIAEESARRAANAENAAIKWEPTDEAKKIYRALARSMHPDLAIDPVEKAKRHALMAELNVAYSAGDQTAMSKLSDDLRNSPDMILGDAIGDQWVRTMRQISQVQLRLAELLGEKASAEGSELFALRTKMQSEREAGRDMVAQMAARTLVQIKKSERRLENLRNVNKAAEDYVKDKYGMDISDFRKP
ncbi:MAG: hypothetical protein WKF34_06675 [Pyrinomonadaceae bacterium]